jgi:hypothetical protein
MSERGTSELQCHRGSSAGSGGTAVSVVKTIAEAI